MSIAPRPAKWTMRPQICAGHCRFGQRATASPSGRTIGVPQFGQAVGITNGRSAPLRRLGIGATTSGITSPARRTTTVSPISTPLRATSSALCSVAIEIVTPPTRTGSSIANGVTAPVRPTLTWMSRSTVVCSSGGNL